MQRLGIPIRARGGSSMARRSRNTAHLEGLGEIVRRARPQQPHRLLDARLPGDEQERRRGHRGGRARRRSPRPSRRAGGCRRPPRRPARGACGGPVQAGQHLLQPDHLGAFQRQPLGERAAHDLVILDQAMRRPSQAWRAPPARASDHPDLAAVAGVVDPAAQRRRPDRAPPAGRAPPPGCTGRRRSAGASVAVSERPGPSSRTVSMRSAVRGRRERAGRPAAAPRRRRGVQQQVQRDLTHRAAGQRAQRLPDRPSHRPVQPLVAAARTSGRISRRRSSKSSGVSGARGVVDAVVVERRARHVAQPPQSPVDQRRPTARTTSGRSA